VRIRGIGEKVDKIRGEIVTKEPKLGPTIALLIAALVITAMTIPR
jgi:hypothetical protein